MISITIKKEDLKNVKGDLDILISLNNNEVEANCKNVESKIMESKENEYGWKEHKFVDMSNIYFKVSGNDLKGVLDKYLK